MIRQRIFACGGAWCASWMRTGTVGGGLPALPASGAGTELEAGIRVQQGGQVDPFLVVHPVEDVQIDLSLIHI